MFAQLKDSLSRLDRRSPIAAGLLAFVLLVPALVLIKADTAPHYALSKAEAAKLARQDEAVAGILAGHEPASARVTPLDREQQRVSFFDGSRWVLDAAVRSGRGVTHMDSRPAGSPESGSSIANAVPVLLLLTLLFILATVTVPLLSLRNLDVFALASFASTIWLLNENFVAASVYASSPPLAYLAARSLNMGLRGTQVDYRVSLLWHLTRGWSLEQRMRVLRLTVVAAAAIVLIVVPSSTGANDVAFAATSGATDLLHGLAPYGHIPTFIFHGDTYPLLTYVLYMPGALLMPVYDSFSDSTGALLVTAFATLLAAAGLYRVGVRLASAKTGGTGPGDEPAQFAGMRIALAWLAFPAVLVSASSGSNDMVLAACVAAAFVCFARRGLSLFVLGVAAWVKVVPALALPFWLARLRRESALRAFAALAGLSAVLILWLMALGGAGAVSAMVDGLAFQLTRGSLQSLWVGTGLGFFQPLADALLVSAVVAAALAVRGDPRLRNDLRRMAALFGGVMLLSQIAANYWTWSYLPWALVPLLLSLLAPAPAPSDVIIRARTRGTTAGHAGRPAREMVAQRHRP